LEQSERERNYMAREVQEQRRGQGDSNEALYPSG